MAEEKSILVDGLWSYEIDENKPDFVLGRLGINVSKFTGYLQANKDKAVNGYLYIDILRAKSGQRYSVLDTYAFDKQQKESTEPSGYERFQAMGQKLENNMGERKSEEINVDDIPF